MKKGGFLSYNRKIQQPLNWITHSLLFHINETKKLKCLIVSSPLYDEKQLQINLINQVRVYITVILRSVIHQKNK